METKLCILIRISRIDIKYDISIEIYTPETLNLSQNPSSPFHSCRPLLLHFHWLPRALRTQYNAHAGCFVKNLAKKTSESCLHPFDLESPASNK